jgi:hypothetical protein
MLAYFIALVVGFGSLAIYLLAFFFPEIHRKNDFIWSGVGLFYALILWIFASRITGGLLLGHVASVALLVWFVGQTFSLRRQLAAEGQQTPIPSPELIKISFQEQISKFSVKEKFAQLSGFIASVFGGAKAKLQQTVNKKPVTKTAEEILQTTATEATPPSESADESSTVTPLITTEGLSAETVSESPVSKSPVLEMVELAPTPPSVIEKEEEEVIPPTETPTETETEPVVEAMAETSESVSEPEVSSPNPVTSELLAAEAAEKSDMTVEEVKPEGEAIPPEQTPPDKPVGE